MRKIQRLTANLVGKTRFDTMEGKTYLVAPMVMLTEGVHSGSGGPLLYPQNELNDCPQAWNHKPVVVYHPSSNGSAVSACDPIILTNRKVGVVMNAKTEMITIEINGKETEIDALKAEAWLDPDRMNTVDERISEAIETNEMMELSTGLFTHTKNEEGEWNGEAYDGIATDYRPDHLALLPDLKGACSIEDGAGFLRNQVVLKARPGKVHMVNNAMSHGNVRSLLNSWLWEKKPDAWTEDVYDDFFIYELTGKFYKLNYKLVDNSVVIDVMTGETEVIKVTEFQTKSGEFVGNKRKVSTMDKKEIVKALIASNGNSWKQEDEELLMGQEETTLVKMQESEKIASDMAVENAVKEAAKTIVSEKVIETVTVNTDTADTKPKTVEQHLDAMPEEMRSMIKNGMNQYAVTKSALIKKITDNDKNVFTPEQLQSKEVDELQSIVALVASDKDESTPDYSGQGLGLTNTAANKTAASKIEPLIAPSILSATKA